MDFIIELVNKQDYGINQGQVPTEIIVVYAGTIGAPVSVVRPEWQ